MDFQGAFEFQLTIIAICLMAMGAVVFWLLTSVVPYLWQHIGWVP